MITFPLIILLVISLKEIDLLLEGKTNRVVAYRDGEFCDYDIDEALNMTKDIDEHLYSLTQKLSR